MAIDRESSRVRRPLKILLTEGSSTSARQTLYALGGTHVIDVLDSAPLGQCRFSRYVRRWCRCPCYWQSPTDYLRFLLEQVRREKYDVLLPTHEQVYLLARVRERLSRHVAVALSSFEAIDQMQSKAGFVRVLRKLQLPHPRTTIIQDQAELHRPWDYPCYVKLALSTAGRGVHLVENAQQMRGVAQRLEQAGLLGSGAELLLQQPAAGTLSVVQTVFQRGRLVGAHSVQARRQGVGGAPAARISTRHPSVLEHMRQLGSYLQWHGALFVEYFYDTRSGCPQYIEANPRIGETLNATLCGVNLCELLLRVSLDEQVEPLGQGTIGVRSHQGFILLLAAALGGANRRRLCAELGRIWSRRGLYCASQDELTRPREDLPSVIPATAVALQLLCTPRRAERIVQQTVDHYSLPDAAARTIRALPADVLQSCFAG